MKSLVILLIPILAFSAAQSGSFKIGVFYDFQQETRGMFYEIHQSFSAAGRDITGSVSLNSLSVESFSFDLGIDPFRISIYRNFSSFPNTPDRLLFYSFDTGQDGFSISLWNIRGVFLTSESLWYVLGNFGWLKALYGIRGDVHDLMVDASLDFHFRVFGEIVCSLLEDDHECFYTAGAADGDWKYGFKYYGGEDRLLPSYTKVDTSKSGKLSLWYSYAPFSVWTDIDTANPVKGSSLGFKVGGKSWMEIYKSGFSKLSLDPREVGEFGVGIGTELQVLGSTFKFSYHFGKPAHNTVRTIGEVYYAEVSKPIGNFYLFGKVQYIIGYYERRLAAYGELKWSGFQNSEVKLIFGNGDFYNVNTLQKVLTLEINTWW